MNALALVQAQERADRERRLAVDVDNKVKKRTTVDLRDMLFSQMDSLREGTSDAQTASAMAKLAQTVLNSAKLEMDFGARCARGDGSIENLTRPITLTGD